MKETLPQLSIASNLTLEVVMLLKSGEYREFLIENMYWKGCNQMPYVLEVMKFF